MTKYIHKKENNQLRLFTSICKIELQFLPITAQAPGSDMYPEATTVTLELECMTHLPIKFTLSQLSATCSFSLGKKSFKLNFQLFCTAGTA